MAPETFHLIAAGMLIVGVGTALKLLFDDGKPKKKRPPIWNKRGQVDPYYSRWPR